MYRGIFKISLFVVALTTCGYAAAGGRGTAAIATPIIVKVAMDAKENTIVITGWNFGGTPPPNVHLAGQVLKVKHVSVNEIVAHLPPNIQPATYGLTVTPGGRNQATSDYFSVALPGQGFVDLTLTKRNGKNEP